MIYEAIYEIQNNELAVGYNVVEENNDNEFDYYDANIMNEVDTCDDYDNFDYSVYEEY